MPTKQKTRKPRVTRERKTEYATKRPRLTRVEARALNEFRARLHQILPRDELKSLIVYGSKARGDARPGSDIDLLVVYDPVHSEKKDEISDAEYEIELNALERNARSTLDLEPLVRTKAQLKEDAESGMPLLQNIAHEGIVLEGEPIVPEQMDRKYWTQVHLEDAKRTLRTARLALADGDIRRAISLAYFIYENAARAALIAKNITPQSYAGTQSLFGQYFIKTGLVSKKFAPHFKRLENDRLEATYTLKKQFTTEDAERALVTAEEMLTEGEKLLPSLLEEN